MDAKHPIVLPKRHHLTGLVVDHIHSRSGHNASPYVINEAKERFHIIGQERTVKHYINTNCMACRNRRSKVGSQLMSPLPAVRVNPSRGAFENCGVDYMGPLEVKQGRSCLPRYCCVFTCLASRATHLEVAYRLTTESFLMAFRRFLSVRGHTTRIIYSDNATNFVGARLELRRGAERLCQHKIINELAPR